MTGTGRTEERIARWLLDEAVGELPDRVFEATFAETRRLTQVAPTPWNRRGSVDGRWDRRLVAAAAVVLLALVVPAVLGNLPGPGGEPSPHPTVTPSPTPGASELDISDWTPFLSDRLGLSLRFPADWTVVPATASWIWQASDPGPSSAATDRAVSPTGQAFVVASQALPTAMTEDEWWTDYLSADTTGMPMGCFPKTRAGYEVVEVAGSTGYLHGGLQACNFTEVVVIVGGRAYQLTAYANVAVASGGIFDRGVFDAWLSTVVFDPAAADDSPTGSSPTPG